MSGFQSVVITPEPTTPNAPGSPPAPEVKPKEGGEKLLAGKYKSAEDLEKAYIELQGKLGQAPKPPEADPAKAAEASAQATEDAAKKTVENAGLDFNEFTQEFATSGKLSDESYAKLEKAGVSRSIVDSYIQGQAALAKAAEAQLLADVGGREGYEKMTDWARKNLSKAEIDAFNASLGGTVEQAKLAVIGLNARFKSASDTEATLLSGKPGAASGDVFRSTAELTAAMRDPRYKTDDAYRKDVADKLARSSIL
jgi:hypothetical protein